MKPEVDAPARKSQGRASNAASGSRRHTTVAASDRRGVLLSFGFIAALLVAVNFLPTDTALRVIRERGTLRACVPTEFPPLVTTDPARPGIEIELLEELASRLSLRLQLHRNPAIGRDFNPRNWRVTRAQCELIAGGVVASATTRSFLETSGPHMETGWAALATAGTRSLRGAKVGFFAGTSGLDRIALSRFLQSQGATVTVLNSRAALVAGLTSGEFTIGVSESLTARQVAEVIGATAMWLPGSLDRYPLAFGLWKGDLTLKRAVDAALSAMRSDGTLTRIVESYRLDEILEECEVCS